MAYPEPLSRGRTQSGRLVLLPAGPGWVAPPYPSQGPAALPIPTSQGPGAFAIPTSQGPAAFAIPPSQGPAALPHLHVSGPSRLAPSPCLRAQQPLPIPTSQGPALSGLLLPPNTCRFVQLQDMVLLAWCAQGRVHLPVIPSLVSVGVHVCVCVHICPECVMTASWGGE